MATNNIVIDGYHHEEVRALSYKYVYYNFIQDLPDFRFSFTLKNIVCN